MFSAQVDSVSMTVSEFLDVMTNISHLRNDDKAHDNDESEPKAKSKKTKKSKTGTSRSTVGTTASESGDILTFDGDFLTAMPELRSDFKVPRFFHNTQKKRPLAYAELPFFGLKCRFVIR